MPAAKASIATQWLPLWEYASGAIVKSKIPYDVKLLTFTHAPHHSSHFLFERLIPQTKISPLV